MRKPIVAGNWKMNKRPSEAGEFAKRLVAELNVKDREVVLCPPFISIPAVVEACSGSDIEVGAQNLYYKERGAYTGEISAEMIADAGCRYVIVGHSERREYFSEDNGLINKKAKAAISHNIIPILCVGEREEERDKGLQKKVVESQLRECLKGVEPNIVIAYEPVWAIGTGRTATPEDAEEMQGFIRELLAEIYNHEVAERVRILYGGSVKPDNIDGLMAKPNIDGALVGGASLDIGFFRIVRYEDKPL
jgi:triosephosphate isomerase